MTETIAQSYCPIKFPDEFYGRETELGLIRCALDRVADGGRELILISGPSGSGKSSLVRHVRSLVGPKGGTWIDGTFDPFLSGRPYSAIADAIAKLAAVSLALPKERLETCRRDTHAILGPNVGVIVDVVPELRQICGRIPSPSQLPPTETRNRFFRVIQRTISGFARFYRPLVICLDNLHWADSDSLRLLELIARSKSVQHLLIIGTYRESAGVSVGSLRTMINRINGDGCPVTELTLCAMKTSHVTALVRGALGMHEEQARALAELLGDHSDGNPLFVRLMLDRLVAEGRIVFDQTEKRWHWDIDAGVFQRMASRLPHLLSRRVHSLGETVMDVLAWAACIGMRFDVTELSQVADYAPQAIDEALKTAIAANVIVLPRTKPLIGDANASAECTDRGTHEFVHEQVRESIYADAATELKKTIHYRWGKHLLERIHAEKENEHLFDVLSHLNRVLGQSAAIIERQELAAHNLCAGRRCERAAAYGRALYHFDTTIALLGTEAWQEHYEITQAAHIAAAETACLSGDYEKLDRFVDATLANARSDEEKVEVYEIIIASLKRRNRLDEVVDVGLKALRLLGVSIKPHPTRLDEALAVAKLRMMLSKSSIEKIEQFGSMTDERHLASMRLLTTLSAVVFAVRPNLVTTIVTRRMALALAHGNSADAAASYAALGLVLCGRLHNIEGGYEYGQLALRLFRRFKDHAKECALLFRVNAFTRPWKEPVRHTIASLDHAYKSGLDNGDFEFAANSASAVVGHMWFCGIPLREVEAKAHKLASELQHLQIDTPRYAIEMVLQMARNLRHTAGDPCELRSGVYDEIDVLQHQIEAHDQTALHYYHANKAWLCYLFGKTKQARLHARKAEETVDGGLATIPVSTFFFIQTLVELSSLRRARSGRRSRKRLKKVMCNYKRMQEWSRYAPQNQGHRCALIRAELCCIKSKPWDAARLYDDAISLARRHGMLHECGIAAELAARFFIESGNELAARTFLAEAQLAYSQWGAKAKVNALIEEFSALMGSASITGSITTSTNRSIKHTGDMVLSAVLKGAQTISGEIVLDRVLETMLGIMVETAGADSGYLVLEDSQTLMICAGFPKEEGTNPLSERPLPVNGSGLAPATLVEHVFRNKEAIVQPNPAAGGQFADDAYFLWRRPKSVLCMAIGRYGVVYLESHKTSRAFSAKCGDTLRLLAAQGAISIENAKLYADLKASSELIENRNRELARALVEAEESARVKTEFLATTSQELRNPLNAIIDLPSSLVDQFSRRELVRCRGCGRLFERDSEDVIDDTTACPTCDVVGKLVLEDKWVFGGDSERFTSVLQKIAKSGRHLLAVVNDVLDMSKIEAGQMTLRAEETDVNEVVFESVDSLKPIANQQGVTIATVIAEDVRIIADREKLARIVFNLVGNAIDMSPEGTTVRVQIAENDEDVLLSVTDYGSLISEEERDVLFDGFRQRNISRKHTYGRTRLGLPIVKRFVELHGGRIWLENGKGQGNRFCCILPRDGPMVNDT